MIGAIDIGGTKIALGVVSPDGRVLAREEFPTQPERGLEDGLTRIIQALRQTSRRAGVNLEGIGVGCTGPVYPLEGVLGPNVFLPGWEGPGLLRGLTQAFQLPVALENDADAAALGEVAWGSGQGKSRFIYITVSTGIGGGIVLDGKLYRGVDSAHPEVGHHVINPFGPACFCGAHGCWESLASGSAMARWAKEKIPTGQVFLGDLDAKAIFTLAAQGFPWAKKAVAREAKYLGLGLANLITLFTPDMIALGGGVMKNWPVLADRVYQVIHQSCGLVPAEKTEIVLAMLGEDTGLVGAARVWVHSGQPG
jgi:glucokinase